MFINIDRRIINTNLIASVTLSPHANPTLHVVLAGGKEEVFKNNVDEIWTFLKEMAEHTIPATGATPGTDE